MRSVVLLLLLLLSSPAFADVRSPAVAGSFYPGDKVQLEYQINKLLLNAPSNLVKGDIVALIVPHAGYPYSGPVAAYAYKQLVDKNFDTITLMGASHQMRFGEIAVPDYEFFETPLGKVPVDRGFIQRLKKISSKVVVDNKPHRDEHSLEVQLPFLQTVLKDFKIVPILFGSISLANCQELAYALSFLVEENTLIIASTDWSHYYPYDIAKRLDERGIDLVLKGDLEGYVKCLAEGDTEACGAPAIITTMLVAPALGANEVKLLKYANSGDVIGDKSRVIGYASIVFSRRESSLGDAEKKRLLKIARKTIENHLAGKKLLEFEIKEGALMERRGAFVTLTKNGELKGCVGYIQPIKPLYQAVQEMVIAAATEDRRFPSVTRNELKDIKIEISALSRLKRVKDVSEIVVGRDGLYIIKGGDSGLLLPQVAVEWGWGREKFLEQVCYKAGLSGDAWKEKDVIIYRFLAEIFHE